MFFVSLALGAYHTLLTTDNGEIWVFGANSVRSRWVLCCDNAQEGQLGLGNADFNAHPIPVMLSIEPQLVKARGVVVVAGAYHSLALSNNKVSLRLILRLLVTLVQVWGWGWNKDSQVSNGGGKAIKIPTIMKIPPPLRNKCLVSLSADIEIAQMLPSRIQSSSQWAQGLSFIPTTPPFSLSSSTIQILLHGYHNPVRR